MERFLVVLKSYKRMDIELENILRQNAKPIHVRKHDILKSPSQIDDNLYFVEKGLLRLYSQDKDRLETLRFKKEDEFIISMLHPDGSSLCEETGIEALEDSLLWCFPGAFVNELQLKFHTFSRQFMAILLKEYESLSIARRSSRPNGGAHNYQQLCELSPELLQRVPLPYLSNYTSIPESVLQHLHSSKKKLLMSTFRPARPKK